MFGLIILHPDYLSKIISEIVSGGLFFQRFLHHNYQVYLKKEIVDSE